MSVLTLVQRALPFPLSWKRRPSTGKGKEREGEITLPDEDSSLFEKYSDTEHAALPSMVLHCDVSDALHVAVKQSPDLKSNHHSSFSERPEIEADSAAEDVTHQASSSHIGSPHGQLGRVVSWASIVRSQCRWTSEQEKELLKAEKQLARCQRAWSSEQEVWLSYVRLSLFPPPFFPL